MVSMFCRMDSLQKNNINAVEKRRNRFVRFGCHFFLATVLFFTVLGNVHSTAGQEYALRAAFVLNFAKFTKWPEGTLACADTVTLCVWGDPSLRSSFQKIQGKKIGDRKLDIRFVQSVDDMADCNMLFVAGQYDEPAFTQLFNAVKGRPILTIGEMDRFTSHGGVINFVAKDGKLRFEISPFNAAQQGGITLSSRLLQLAIIVDDK